MKIIDLKKGLTFHRKSDESVFYNDLKRIFEFSNMAYWDPCCSEIGVSPQPLQVNGDTGNLETFDGTEWVVFDTTPAAISTNTISEQTAANGVAVDGVLLKDGGVTANSMIAAFYPSVAQNDIAAGTGGAILVTNYLTTINTDAGGDAFTLANGTQIGQMKKILLVADGGGDGVVTPATAFAGGTTATFNDAGDYVILQWSGTAWVVLENSGTTIA